MCWSPTSAQELRVSSVVHIRLGFRRNSVLRFDIWRRNRFLQGPQPFGPRLGNSLLRIDRNSTRRRPIWPTLANYGGNSAKTGGIVRCAAQSRNRLLDIGVGRHIRDVTEGTPRRTFKYVDFVSGAQQSGQWLVQEHLQGGRRGYPHGHHVLRAEQNRSFRSACSDAPATSKLCLRWLEA